MAGEREGAGGIAVDAVDFDGLLNGRVREDVCDLAWGAGGDTEGNGFGEVEVTFRGVTDVRADAGDTAADIANQVTLGVRLLVGNDLAKVHFISTCYFGP